MEIFAELIKSQVGRLLDRSERVMFALCYNYHEIITRKCR